MSRYPNLDAIANKIAANRSAFAATAASIQADSDYSSEAKRRKIAEEHHKSREAHEALFAAYQAEKAAIGERLRHAAFSLGSDAHLAPGDRQARRAAHSAALTAAGQAETPQQLKTLLKNARLAGDEVLAVSVAHTAFERGQGEVLDDFLEQHPKRREALEEFQDFERSVGNRSPRGQLADRLAMSAPILPREAPERTNAGAS